MTTTLQEFFTERVPAAWFEGELAFVTDDDEILCVLPLASGAPSVEAFRESTRDARMAIAAEAEAHFQRRVSWGCCAKDRPRCSPRRARR